MTKGLNFKQQVVHPKRVDGSMSDWMGESTWIGGACNYSRGEFIYQDYIYDDYGAATGIDAGTGPEKLFELSRQHGKDRAQFSRALLDLAPTAGSYRYPADSDRYGSNCADLVQLRIAADNQNIYFLVLLNTLLTPDSTVFAIAFDTGGSDPGKCKGHIWPFEAGITTPGTTHVLTLWGTGGAWDELDLTSVGGQVAVSVEENVIEASIPRELLGTLRFWCYAATGLWDSQDKTWLEVKEKRDTKFPGGAMPGGPRAFNLAFRPNETGTWFEDKQAALLRSSESALRTGTVLGDLHMAAQFIDLENPPDTPHVPPPTGYYQRIYRASASPGEGVSENGIPARGATGAKLGYQFLGQYQPYAVYVPESYDGVLLYLHGGATNHTAVVSEKPMQRDIGDFGKKLIVCPLGRGLIGGFIDYSYLDALEVLEDVLKHYHVNENRVYVSGWSMGGQGANRFLTTRPDLFAASFQLAPGEIRPPESPHDITTNPGVTIDLYENVRHIPILYVLGRKDRTGNSEFSFAKIERLKAMGYMYRSHIHPIAGHVDFRRADYWIREADWLKDKELVRAPAHVTYKICEAWWRPDISPKLVFDHAYWISGLKVRDKSRGLESFGKVDAVSHALGGSDPDLKHFHYSLPGPPARYEIEGQEYTWPGRMLEQYNGCRAVFENLRAVSFETESMGLNLSESIRFDTVSDGPVEVKLLGTWSAINVRMDGTRCSNWNLLEDALRISVSEGSHSFKISPH